MSNTPHTLHEEFPAEADRIHRLKISDAHFARLLRDYDAANDLVHRAETRIDLVTPQAETDLRKSRSQLKDQIWALLKKA